MGIDHYSQLAVGLLKIFVYGTLKPGEANFDRHCQQALEQKALEIQEAIALPRQAQTEPNHMEGDRPPYRVFMGTVRRTSCLHRQDVRPTGVNLKAVALTVEIRTKFY